MRGQWAVDGGNWQVTGQTQVNLEPGVYVPRMGFAGPYLERKKIVCDALLPLEDAVSGRVVEGIRVFRASEAKFRKFGLIHKRGVLLEGEPGSGKTATTYLVGEQIVEDGGVVLFPTIYQRQHIRLLAEGLKMVRNMEPKMLILVVIEDLDKIVALDESQKGVLTDLLAILDGEDQINNVVFLATTNFIGKLDARIRNRPSRFDEVIPCPPLTPKAREQYLRHFLPEGHDEELRRWVRITEGLYPAHLKEFFISVHVTGHDEKEVLERVRSMAGDVAVKELTEADYEEIMLIEDRLEATK